jgi:hypothetical protein
MLLSSWSKTVAKGQQALNLVRVFFSTNSSSNLTGKSSEEALKIANISEFFQSLNLKAKVGEKLKFKLLRILRFFSSFRKGINLRFVICGDCC